MRVVWIFLILLIVSSSVGITIRSYQKADTATGELDQERYLRMTSEEDLHSAKKKIKTLETQLTAEKKSAQEVIAKLAEVQSANQDLQARLEKAADLKGQLEKKIKEIERLSSALK